ncbi:MAG: serine kinase [Acholeplasmataceae bacterium]|jgi:predicted transcriptional regulator|nr:DRTGG domain-containing protein [Acidaminococcaceae bacterium]NLY83764.1 serine kinase [Acholeplasmataceae bacterium]
MKLQKIVEALDLMVATKNADLGAEVSGGYASDLLSNVMGQAKTDMLWITMQGHQNIAAVAALLGLSAVIVAGGSHVEKDALEKAERNSVVILTTDLPAYEVIGRIYALGVKNEI